MNLFKKINFIILYKLKFSIYNSIEIVYSFQIITINPKKDYIYLKNI